MPGIHVLLSLRTSQKEDVDGRDEGPVGSAQQNGNQDGALHLYVPFRVSLEHGSEGHPLSRQSRWKKSGDPLSCSLIAAPLY
jgi:hypothetical protein